MFRFSQFFKRRAIRRYIKVLGPMLLKSYGPRESYTNGQISAVLDSSALNQRYQKYAYALFGELYPDQHQELSQGLFNGNAFNALQVIAIAKPTGWKGGTNTDNLSNHYGQNSRY
ncbi:DUF6559 family protein [Photobacterium sp. DNB23_23_1]|uniref:Uncharacterized protein n=1 Tax=Photobacterium pectinilyticum TaxID=2906793 RepID=A0ABT1N1R1_9GAMM|nr:DUF6559 family protein [Photobacterium sp. ZSDE20]MCQ1058678.1 hypothetical protein [Photobacterium sp. ZSDE20]MDD1823392.1 hypothetical protein [Photobacterium sp. ZSDE20]